MKKPITILVMLIVIIGMVSAGCSDDGGGGKKSTTPEELQTASGTIPSVSGWIASPEGSGDETEHTETVTLTGPATAFTVTVSIKDSDAEHAETDEGSDPDSAKVKVFDETGQSQTQSIVSGSSYTFKFPKAGGGNATEVDEESGTPMMGQMWTIQIKGEQFGSGKPAYFFGFIIWIDQGLAWELSGSYQYVTSEIEEPAE